ncbi:MAG: diadenylate cyclase [Planctomycetota bacterium]|nr:diadenylate cyclase [Planctomycetota bacterium]
MDQTYKWALQVAIVAPGLYLFLRFLRTTRGGGVLRGLVVALLFVVIGLWGLAKELELEELNHLIRSTTPFLAVILTILFQPELRRAIARLGERNRFVHLLQTRRYETLQAVVEAVCAMSARRHGALIAFQRETALDAYTQNAVKIDAEIRRLLIEGVFHPGSALHDGAVVIDGDRIAAAACLFPLTENIEISKSTGTRHRAALGLTEETDAVTLVVSEETGSIALCQQGQMERHIAPEDLELALRTRLEQPSDGDEGEHAAAPSNRISKRLQAVFTHDLPRKAAAILLAAGMIWLAHQVIVIDRDLTLAVAFSDPGDPASPAPGQLLIRLPDQDYQLVSPAPSQALEFVVSGTRGQVDRIGFDVNALLSLGSEVSAGTTEFPFDKIVWNVGEDGDRLGLEFRWKSGTAPLLRLERHEHHLITLAPEHVPIDASELNPRFQALVDAIEFADHAVDVEGPRAIIEQVGRGELAFELEPIVLVPEDRTERRARLRLAEGLRALGLSIAEDRQVQVTLRIVPAERLLVGSIEKEIKVSNLGASEEDPALWRVFDLHDPARFAIRMAGIIPVTEEAGSQAYEEKDRVVRQFVEDNLKVWVDISELRESEGTTLPLQWNLLGDSWREGLSASLGEELDDLAELELILESEGMIKLQKSEQGTE